MKVYPHTHGPQRMNSNNFGDPLICSAIKKFPFMFVVIIAIGGIAVKFHTPHDVSCSAIIRVFHPV